MRRRPGLGPLALGHCSASLSASTIQHEVGCACRSNTLYFYSEWRLGYILLSSVSTGTAVSLACALVLVAHRWRCRRLPVCATDSHAVASAVPVSVHMAPPYASASNSGCQWHCTAVARLRRLSRRTRRSYYGSTTTTDSLPVAWRRWRRCSAIASVHSKTCSLP